MQHPTNFFIAHRLFSGRAFPKGPVWGALTDGPEDRGEVVDRICEWAAEDDDQKPSLATLRVWWFQDDVPVRDVTEDVLAEAFAQRWAA
jgi:hypothetical protein